MNRIVVGVDIAKRVFQLHWVEAATGEIVALQLKREKFLEHFVNRSSCLIGMEACGGSQHWARSLRKLGHEVRLLSGQMVKPFVGGNKNDAADARAIWTAVQQPGIKVVSVKSEEQQAVLALHRMREQLVKFRTAQSNGLRGLLTEYGEGCRRAEPGSSEMSRACWGGYPIGYRRW
jgi:transposase